MVEFAPQDELEELQARLYLDTRKRFSKKEILELLFRIGKENYDLIVKEVQSEDPPLSDETIKDILSLAEDFGPGSEDLSTKADDITYRGNQIK